MVIIPPFEIIDIGQLRPTKGERKMETILIIGGVVAFILTVCGIMVTIPRPDESIEIDEISDEEAEAMIKDHKEENMDRWLTHFTLYEIDEIISKMVLIKDSENDDSLTIDGKTMESDYYRIKLHYAIETFVKEQEEDKTLLEIVNETYTRLNKTIDRGLRQQRRDDHIEEITS